MASITSANVACGYHAGDPAVMRRTVRLARDGGGCASARIPGLPDLQGSAGARCASPPQEVEDLVLYQIGALAAIAQSEGVRLQHVKPHGALYNMAARDRGAGRRDRARGPCVRSVARPVRAAGLAS